MENEVECGEGIQGAHGFGHTTSGQLKIVRLFSPPIVPKEPVSITKPLKYCVEICKLDEKDEKKKKLFWSKNEVHSQVPYLRKTLQNWSLEMGCFSGKGVVKARFRLSSLTWKMKSWGSLYLHQRKN